MSSADIFVQQTIKAASIYNFFIHTLLTTESF